MNKVLALMCFLLTIGHQSFAVEWTEIGNGGDALICKQRRQFYMYDAYEAASRYALPPQFPFLPPQAAPPQTVEGFLDYGGEAYLDASIELATQIIESIKPIDRSRYELYLQWIQDFKKDARFIEDAEFFDIPDTGIGYIPPGCNLHQLIVQRTPMTSHDRRYQIAMDYWRLLPPEQQAVGILHEVIYREALQFKPSLKTSEPVRYFNTLLLSKELIKIPRDEYRKLVFDLFEDLLDRKP